MGFLDLFRRKKQKQEEVIEKEIKISELSDQVNNIEKEKFGDFYKKFSDYAKKIEALSKEIDKHADPL